MIRLVAYFEVPTAIVDNAQAIEIMQSQAVVLAGEHGFKIGQRSVGPAEQEGMSVMVWDLIDVRGLGGR